MIFYITATNFVLFNTSYPVCVVLLTSIYMQMFHFLAFTKPDSYRYIVEELDYMLIEPSRLLGPL
jgi:hypothetical protein